MESTLRPLHTIFRRIGWIYHMRTAARADLQATVAGHIAVIDAVASGDVHAAIAASDSLMDFVESMFSVLEREVSPAVLDCSLDAAEMLHLAEAIRSVVEHRAVPHGLSPFGKVTLSIGVAVVVPTAHGGPEALLRHADQALYLAKSQGRNQVVSSAAVEVLV